MTDFPFPIEEGLKINFDNADIVFVIDDVNRITDWLRHIVIAEKASVSQLNYIFCSDDYLHKINLEYLDHDTYTDIITFPINEDPIQSDIFISVDRVNDNAQVLSVSFKEELHRVMAHGLLHLLGYGDKTQDQQLVMRGKEDTYLNQLRLIE